MIVGLMKETVVARPALFLDDSSNEFVGNRSNKSEYFGFDSPIDGSHRRTVRTAIFFPRSPPVTEAVSDLKVVSSV